IALVEISIQSLSETLTLETSTPEQARLLHIVKLHVSPNEIREPLVRRSWNQIAGFSRILGLSFVINRAYEKIDELLLQGMTVRMRRVETTTMTMMKTSSYTTHRQHHDPTVKRYSNGRALNFGRPKKLAGYARNTYCLSQQCPIT
ncbi:hypothetical protein V1477_009689, partial [Vespula maculifrons]